MVAISYQSDSVHFSGCWVIGTCSIQSSYRKDSVCHARDCNRYIRTMISQQCSYLTRTLVVRDLIQVSRPSHYSGGKIIILDRLTQIHTWYLHVKAYGFICFLRLSQHSQHRQNRHVSGMSQPENSCHQAEYNTTICLMVVKSYHNIMLPKTELSCCYWLNK